MNMADDASLGAADAGFPADRAEQGSRHSRSRALLVSEAGVPEADPWVTAVIATPPPISLSPGVR
jgi:hypothetical protein